MSVILSKKRRASFHQWQALQHFPFKVGLLRSAQRTQWSPGRRPACNDDGDDNAQIINHTSAAS